MISIKVKKLHEDAVIPKYATPGSACFDLHALNDGVVIQDEIFDTGIAFEIPNNHVMLVFSRSGLGFKNGIRLANCVGVIDSDYRNSVMIKLTNDSNNTYCVSKGDRIAQAMVISVDQCEFFVTNELSDTERGTGGFGSTGK